jgi:hypothetical protein
MHPYAYYKQISVLTGDERGNLWGNTTVPHVKIQNILTIFYCDVNHTVNAFIYIYIYIHTHTHIYIYRHYIEIYMQSCECECL